MFRTFVQASRLVWRVGRLQVSLLVVATVIDGCIPAIKLWIGKTILDLVVAGAPDPQRAFRQLLPTIGLLVLVTVVSSVLAQVTATLSALLGDRVSTEVNLLVMRHATILDLRHFEHAAFHDKLRLAQQDAAFRPLALLSDAAQFIRGTVTLVAVSAILVRFHPAALLFALIMGLPHIFIEKKHAAKDYLLRCRNTPTWRQMSYLGLVLTSIEHFKEVRLFRLGDLFLERYQALFVRTYAEQRRLAVLNCRAGAIVVSIVAIGYALVYAYAIRLTLLHVLTVGDLTLYAGAYASVQSEVSAGVKRVSSAYKHGLFINNLFEFLAITPTLIDRPRAIPCPSVLRHGLELRHVFFRYGTSGPWVLDDVTLTIAPGERMVLVGENGAGKTTLVKLLCRLYDPTKGEILFEGMDLRDLRLREYQRLISIVFQDSGRYHLLARENIGMGDVEAIEDRDRIVRAAVASGANCAIEKLAGQYDAMLGTYFTDGQELSIGEWQMVGIARAVMRDGPILICDEPTAPLDPRNEHDVLSRIEALARGKMSIIVSHRLSTAVEADRIVVLDKGRVVEEGVHEHLLRQGGTYARLFSLQASRYEKGSLKSAQGRV